MSAPLMPGAQITFSAPIVSRSIASTSAFEPLLRLRFTQELSCAISVPWPSVSTPARLTHQTHIEHGQAQPFGHARSNLAVIAVHLFVRPSR